MYLGLSGVKVPILFGNDLLWNDLPYSKGLLNFGCPEPFKIMFDFEFFVGQKAFDPVCKGPLI